MRRLLRFCCVRRTQGGDKTPQAGSCLQGQTESLVPSRKSSPRHLLESHKMPARLLPHGSAQPWEGGKAAQQSSPSLPSCTSRKNRFVPRCPNLPLCKARAPFPS